MRANEPESVPTEIEVQINREAALRSQGDIALWYHYRTLRVGEWLIAARGETSWELYLRKTHLDQYPAVEGSVIQGWRKYIQKTMGVSPDKQRDHYRVNCAVVLDWVRRKRQSNELAVIFKPMAKTFHTAATKGDVEFFRAVGRLLSERKKSDGVKRFDYADAMLSRWITDDYWLMPAKLVSRRISVGLGIDDNLKSFLASKSRYGLKSHKPSLVAHFEEVPNGLEGAVLTRHGASLLRVVDKVRHT